ncbi:MAG: hypothetical protein ACRDQU_12075 [Pseudonocardiaceae bacterium]
MATWFGGAVWIGSWYLMYLEITRWHHVKPSLAFNADLDPGTGIRPHPGQALILLYIGCIAAPLAFVAGLVIQIRRRRVAPLKGSGGTAVNLESTVRVESTPRVCRCQAP